MIGNKPKHQILLTLNRFYRDCRTKNKIIDEQLVQILRDAPNFTMSMTEARTKLGASDNLFKKVYQGLKARDVIEYIKNDLNIHKKIITVRDPRTTPLSSTSHDGTILKHSPKRAISVWPL